MKYCPQCEESYADRQRFCLKDGARLSLRDPYHLVGRTLASKFRLDALVGVGGMGAVYYAYHTALDRRVAFKILQPNLALGNARTIDLFEREARLAGQLIHENIVLVLDAGLATGDIAYIAMEWLDGRTLEEELAVRGPLGFEHAGEILRQVAAALDAAHARRIIHRDLKPANVMLSARADGRECIKVLDFGIGKALDTTAGSPVSSVMGTPHYASPEQFQLNGRIDGRADIYSLGVMLFQMLTGALPFDATSVHELVHLHLTAAPPPLRSLRPDAPVAVERLLDRMLSKEPDGRPARASEIPILFDNALRATLGREKEENRGERQEQERRSFPTEATERLTPPASAAANPSPPSSQTPPAAPPRISKRFLYAGLGGLFIFIAGLAITWRIIGDGARLPLDGDRPSATPTSPPPPAVAAKQERSATPEASPAPSNGLAMQTINGRWVINSDDTVVDTQTNLMWMKKDFRVLEGRFVKGWQEAMGWAAKLNGRQYAAHSDWKVPSISEYKSIRDRTAYPKVFESQGEDCFWSRNEINASVASYIYMRGESGGAAVSGSKEEGTNKPGVLFNGNFSVRLVRQAK